MAEQWASNMAQWVRTALTDIYHAMGQAEMGQKHDLAQEMKEIATRLEAKEKELQVKFHVPPATGVGRRRKKKS